MEIKTLEDRAYDYIMAKVVEAGVDIEDLNSVELGAIEEMAVALAKELKRQDDRAEVKQAKRGRLVTPVTPSTRALRRKE